MFHNKKAELNQYISENCNICGEELVRVEDIFVDVENDTYICLDCAKYNHIKTVECKEY